MAQVQLNFTLPDDKITDVIEALRAYYNVPTATAEQLIILLENEAKTRVRNAYVAYMRSKVYDISLD
jgi:hypothetical protein